MCIHDSVTVSLPVKTYSCRIWSDIQLHSGNSAWSGFTLRTGIFLCTYYEQFFKVLSPAAWKLFFCFSYCAMNQILLFTLETKTKKKEEDSISSIHSSYPNCLQTFFYKIPWVYLFCYWFLSCSYERFLVYCLGYAASMSW